MQNSLIVDWSTFRRICTNVHYTSRHFFMDGKKRNLPGTRAIGFTSEAGQFGHPHL